MYITLIEHTSSITSLTVTMWKIKGEIEYNKAIKNEHKQQMEITKKWINIEP